jgi:hypothetical protein
MVDSTEQAVQQGLLALERFGVLLFSDPALPSLVGMIVGEPLRTSWWGHPRGRLIYHAMNALGDQPDVLTTKLVAGKLTYVHRELWPAVFTVATSREGWQLNDLSPAARWLRDLTEAEGEVQTNDLPPPPPNLDVRRKRVPDFARHLERRLLVHTTEFHTPGGAHAKTLQTWQRWADGVKLAPPSLPVAEARRQLEKAVERLAAGVPGGTASLPWQTPKKR